MVKSNIFKYYVNYLKLLKATFLPGLESFISGRIQEGFSLTFGDSERYKHHWTNSEQLFYIHV